VFRHQPANFSTFSIILKIKLSQLSNIFEPMFQVYTDTFFFTATINSWQSLLEEDAFKEIVIESLEYMCKVKRIELYSFVVMPNHIHLLFTLLNTEKQAAFQRDFLKFTSQQIIKALINSNQLELLGQFKSTQKDRIYHIWERRPNWIRVNSIKILVQKVNYIHQNPLQEHWKLVSKEQDYFWSSASFYELDDNRFSFLTNYFD